MLLLGSHLLKGCPAKLFPSVGAGYWESSSGQKPSTVGMVLEVLLWLNEDCMSGSRSLNNKARIGGLYRTSAGPLSCVEAPHRASHSRRRSLAAWTPGVHKRGEYYLLNYC